MIILLAISLRDVRRDGESIIFIHQVATRTTHMWCLALRASER